MCIFPFVLKMLLLRFYSTTQSFRYVTFNKKLQLKQKWFETLQFNTFILEGNPLMPLNELEEFKFLNTLYPIEKLQRITLEVNPRNINFTKSKSFKRFRNKSLKPWDSIF